MLAAHQWTHHCLVIRGRKHNNKYIFFITFENEICDTAAPPTEELGESLDMDNQTCGAWPGVQRCYSKEGFNLLSQAHLNILHTTSSSVICKRMNAYKETSKMCPVITICIMTINSHTKGFSLPERSGMQHNIAERRLLPQCIFSIQV